MSKILKQNEYLEMESTAAQDSVNKLYSNTF